MASPLLSLAAVLLTPVLLVGQVRPPETRPVQVEQPPVRVEGDRGCELAADPGLILTFADCPTPGAEGLAREVEIVEYRNGDAPQRVSAVSVGGVAQRDLDVRSLSWSDVDDDGDGMPTLEGDASARRTPGRMKVGRVTLRRTAALRVGRNALPGQADDLDSDGFPDLAVSLDDPSGATTTIAFGGCRVAPAPDAAPEEVTLVCREVRTEPAPDANPYARFIAGAMDHPGAELPLVDRRAPASPTAAPGAREGPRAFRLEGTRLEGWSVGFDPARAGTARWSLEVRVRRIERG